MSKTLRIFVASTAEDLKPYRAAVVTVIDRLGHKAVHMETFGAMPSWSLDGCRHLVGDCDALVVMIGHRYGWVPSVQQGGDGKKSITWHEVEAARATDVPVFAFLVDEQARWTEPKEQDRLLAAKSPSEAAAILTAVQSLRELKQDLEQQPCDTFASPDELAAKVSTALSTWLTGARPPYVERGWWIHPQLGLRVPAPDGWRAMELMNNFYLVSPEAGTDFRDNFNVQQIPVPGVADAADLMRQNVSELESIPTVTVDASELRTVDGHGAAFFLYHGRLPGQATDLRYCCLIVVKGDRQIVITASVSQERWAGRASMVDDMMARVTFKPLAAAQPTPHG